MTSTSPVQHRQFRSRAEILALLEEQQQSGLKVKAFCLERSIPEGSFHNWKKRYEKKEQPEKTEAFSPIEVTPSFSSLFAEVNGIKLYQPVTAAYLKELSL